MFLAKDIISELHGLENLPVPILVRDIEIGPDSTGDSSVWVWVELQADQVNSEDRASIRETVRETVSKVCLEKEHVSPWVYVRFREVSELQAS